MDQGQKETFDAPLDPIHFAGQALEVRKFLNTNEEQEAIGKGETPGYQGQNQPFDAPLEPISHNGQVVEQGESPNPIEEQ